MKNATLRELKRQAGKVPFARDIYHGLMTCAHYLPFLADFRKFKKLQAQDGRFSISWLDQYPQLYDKTGITGFEPHYLYHPAWAARVISENMPKLHIDFSSILHFSTLVSAFVPVDFYDYRPADIRLQNLRTKKGDLLAMPFPDDSVESLSCMHTVEHVGLGRYGDPLDPAGDLKAIAELKRVLAPGGTLLFVTPISGNARIEFNAHRIYTHAQVLECFSGLALKEFSLIPDNAVEIGMIRDATKEQADAQKWGCGCYFFTKPLK